jgi:hypothetical protein
MRNWKTTLTGLVTAICIAVYPIISTGQISWPAVGLAALVAAIGYFAKDFDVE